VLLWVVSVLGMELLRLSVAARRVGLHPDTLRVWADAVKVEVVWVGRERRFAAQALEGLVAWGLAPTRERREALYVRVSGARSRRPRAGVGRWCWPPPTGS